jgi:hypothetical protein
MVLHWLLLCVYACGGFEFKYTKPSVLPAETFGVSLRSDDKFTNAPIVSHTLSNGFRVITSLNASHLTIVVHYDGDTGGCELTVYGSDRNSNIRCAGEYIKFKMSCRAFLYDYYRPMGTFCREYYGDYYGIHIVLDVSVQRVAPGYYGACTHISNDMSKWLLEPGHHSLTVSANNISLVISTEQHKTCEMLILAFGYELEHNACETYTYVVINILNAPGVPRVKVGGNPLGGNKPLSSETNHDVYGFNAAIGYVGYDEPQNLMSLSDVDICVSFQTKFA